MKTEVSLPSCSQEPLEIIVSQINLINILKIC
jgi:hypothetical protein